MTNPWHKNEVDMIRTNTALHLDLSPQEERNASSFGICRDRNRIRLRTRWSGPGPGWPRTSPRLGGVFALSAIERTVPFLDEWTLRLVVRPR